MTVTELREALQQLKAEGKGGLEVVIVGDHYTASAAELQSLNRAPSIEGATDVNAEDGLRGPVVVLQ